MGFGVRPKDQLNLVVFIYNMEISDRALIKDIKKYQCSECIAALRERHAGLIFNIHGKYGGLLSSLHFNKEEFNDEINYLVYTSAQKFDLRRKKIKFSTFLGNQTK